MELRYVKFSDIQFDRAANSYRDDDEFADAYIESLAEDELENGLLTPLIAQEQAKGKYTCRDGHRRGAAISLNIAKNAPGFAQDMLIPILVIPADMSEAEVVKKTMSVHMKRKGWSDIGKIRAAVRMKALGMTNLAIAPVLETSATSVGRLLTLGTNPKWMKHVADHDIPSSTAVNLLQVAEKARRINDLDTAFDEWRGTTLRTIEAEDHKRRANGETSLTVEQKRLQVHLKPEQVAAWADQLRSGRPLGPPSFGYKVQIRADKGVRRLEIESVNKALESLSLEELGRIAGRIVDLGADLRKAISEKVATRKEVQADGDVDDDERPARRSFASSGSSWTVITARIPRPRKKLA